MNTTTKNVLIGIVAVVIVLLLIWIILPKTSKLGASIVYTTDTYIYGLAIGNADNTGCIKMKDSGDSSFTYIYTINGAVSSSTLSPFAGACQTY